MKRLLERFLFILTRRKAHKYRMKRIDQFFNSTSIKELEKMLENVIKGEVKSDKKVFHGKRVDNGKWVKVVGNIFDDYYGRRD